MADMDNDELFDAPKVSRMISIDARMHSAVTHTVNSLLNNNTSN